MSLSLRQIRDWIPMLVLIAAIGAVAIFPASTLLLIALAIAASLVLLRGTTALLQPRIALFGLGFVLYSRTSDILSQEYGVPGVAYLMAIVVVTALIYTHGIWIDWIPPAHVWQPILLYTLAILATTLVATDLAASTSYLIELAKNLVFVAVILLAVRSLDDHRSLSWALLSAGTLAATFSLIQALTGTRFEFFGFGTYLEQPLVYDAASEVARPGGPVGDPNFFALMLVPLIPIAYYLVQSTKAWYLKILGGMAIGILIGGTLATYSRGGILAIGAMILVMAVIGLLRWRIVLIGGLILILSLPLIPSTFANRFDQIESGGAALRSESTDTEDPAVSGRVSEMIAGFDMLVDHPFLGVGIGNYQENYQEYARSLGIDRRANRAAHSLPIEALAETGLIGFSALLVLFGTVMVMLRATWLDLRNDAVLQMAAKAHFAGLAGFLAASAFLHDAFPRYMWLVLAASYGVTMLAERRRRRRETAFSRLRSASAHSPL